MLICCSTRKLTYNKFTAQKPSERSIFNPAPFISDQRLGYSYDNPCALSHGSSKKPASQDVLYVCGYVVGTSVKYLVGDVTLLENKKQANKTNHTCLLLAEYQAQACCAGIRKYLTNEQKKHTMSNEEVPEWKPGAIQKGFIYLFIGKRS